MRRIARNNTPAESYPVSVPDGSRGDWAISTVFVGDAEATIANMRHVVRDFPEGVVYPGRYKRLVGPCGVMMSNTQLEYRTNKAFIDKAEGHVLVTGLGLGMVIDQLLAKPSVRSITVVEKEKDIVHLVAPTYANNSRVRIIRADAFRWKPDRFFDTAWHDIWPTISPDNIPQFDRLRERYGENVVGDQMCWAEDICVRLARKKEPTTMEEYLATIADRLSALAGGAEG